MMTAKERYMSDPTFHAIVDMLRQELRRSQFTPTELREAVILAATIHESETVQPLFRLTRGEARTLGIDPEDPTRCQHQAEKFTEYLPPRYNAGQRCDMLVGPCACGAWHTPEVTDEA